MNRITRWKLCLASSLPEMGRMADLSILINLNLKMEEAWMVRVSNVEECFSQQHIQGSQMPEWAIAKTGHKCLLTRLQA